MGDLPAAMALAAASATSSCRLAEAAERDAPSGDFRSGPGSEPVAAPATSTLANTNVRAAPRPKRRG